jgi:hypothetical protein
MSKSYLYAFLGLILPIGLGLYFFHAPVNNSTTSRNEIKHEADLRQAVSDITPLLPLSKNSNTLNTEAKPLVSSEISKLARAFFASKNLREFIEMAKQHPELGGNTYLFRAGLLCMSVHETELKSGQIIPATGEDTAVTKRRQDSLDTLTQLCQGVTSADYSGHTFDQRMIEADQRNDVYDAATSEPVHDKKVAAFLKLGDIYLITRLESGGLHSTSPNNDAKYYDGNWYPNTPESLSDIEYAWHLVPCYSGTPCGKDNPYLMVECALKGKCFDDIQAQLLSALNGDKERLTRIQTLAQSIVDNIRKKNVGAFVAPAKK